MAIKNKEQKSTFQSQDLGPEEIAVIGAQFCFGLVLGWCAGVVGLRVSRCPPLVSAAVAALLMMQVAELAGWLEVDWHDFTLGAGKRKMIMADWVKENFYKLTHEYRVFTVGFISGFYFGYVVVD